MKAMQVIFVILASTYVAAKAGSIQQPQSLNVTVNSTAIFQFKMENGGVCSWNINEESIDPGSTPPGIKVISVPNASNLSVFADEGRNMSKIQCVATLTNYTVVYSEEAILLIQGRLEKVTNLRILSSSSMNITLTWVPPFSLDITGVEPDFNYTIEVFNNGSRIGIFELEGGPMVDRFVFSPDNPDPTVLYEFVITAVNGLRGEQSDRAQGQCLGPLKKLFFSSNETHITVTWTPPDSPLELTHCVTVTNFSGLAVLNTTCGITTSEFVFTVDDPNPNDLFEISITPMTIANPIYPGQETLLFCYFIGEPVVIPRKDITTSFELDPLKVNFSFYEEVVSASPGRRPSSYSVLATNDSSQCQYDDVMSVTVDGVVTLMVDDCGGCLSQGEKYRLYSFIIRTVNEAGASSTEKIFLGTGLFIEVMNKIVIALGCVVAFLFLFIVGTFVFFVCRLVYKMERKPSARIEAKYQEEYFQDMSHDVHRTSESNTTPDVTSGGSATLNSIDASTSTESVDVTMSYVTPTKDELTAVMLMIMFDGDKYLCCTIPDGHGLRKYFGECHYDCVDMKTFNISSPFVMHDNKVYMLVPLTATTPFTTEPKSANPDATSVNNTKSTQPKSLSMPTQETVTPGAEISQQMVSATEEATKLPPSKLDSAHLTETDSEDIQQLRGPEITMTGDGHSVPNVRSFFIDTPTVNEQPTKQPTKQSKANNPVTVEAEVHPAPCNKTKDTLQPAETSL